MLSLQLLQPVFLSEGSQLLQQARQEMEALSEFVTAAQVCYEVEAGRAGEHTQYTVLGNTCSQDSHLGTYV
jgi:hypothetical protein